MQIQLSNIPIHPFLQGYVEKLWVVEASARIPNPDRKIIVPNGMVKLIIPFRNGLIGQRDGYNRLSKKHQLTIIGISDTPFVVDAENDAPSGTIGIEFSPVGAYRFFNMKHSDLKNQIFLASEFMNKEAKNLENLIAGTGDVNQKINIVQSFLLKLFLRTQKDEVFDFCVQRIKQTFGRISVKELEKQTGYSSRWLNMKFEERIGLSPKNLCAITRFQFVYQTLIKDPPEIIANKAYYQIYYDQSHFIREFKRFTGLPPLVFQSSNNEFGKLFCKD